MPKKHATDRDEYAYGTFIEFAPRSLWAGEDGEPSRFVQEFAGKIFFESPEAGRRSLAGDFAVQFIDLGGALNARVSYHDVYDTMQSTFDVFQTLYDMDTYDVREDVAKLAFGTDYQFNEGVLIIDRLEVLPTHRGHLVGLRAMKALIEQFRAGAGLVVLKAFPLQFEGELGPGPRTDDSQAMWERLKLQDFTRSERVAKSKLKKYYGRLGFVPVPKTEYMVLDPQYPLPDLEDIDKPHEEPPQLKTGKPRLTLVERLQGKR